MSSERQKEATKAALHAEWDVLVEELQVWREGHPEASFDEIANQVTPRRRALMGKLLEALARQHGNGVEVAGIACEVCGQPMVYKGQPLREIGHLEGESELQRAYYHCPHCKGGVFPPGSAAEVGGSSLDT
jgi:hypothetical protein